MSKYNKDKEGLFLSLFEHLGVFPLDEKQARKQTGQARRLRIPRAISPR